MSVPNMQEQDWSSVCCDNWPRTGQIGRPYCYWANNEIPDITLQ